MEESENKSPLESYRMIFIDEQGNSWDSNGNQLPKPIVKTYPLHEYEIWIEGYAVTGESGIAQCLGKEKGRTFQDACMRYFLKSAIKERENLKETDYFDVKRWDYNPYKNDYWGCRLFETEEEARKSFG